MSDMEYTDILLDSRLRGNDVGRAGTGACPNRVEQVPAEGLGVSPNSLISPQE